MDPSCGQIWYAEGGGDFLSKGRPVVVIQSDLAIELDSITIGLLTTNADSMDVPLVRIPILPTKQNSLTSPSWLSTLLRIPFSIPIWILSALMPIAPVILVSLAANGVVDEDSVNGAAAAAFFLPLVLMLLFRQKYPRWWFNFSLELVRFQYRVGAYGGLLTDRYPSTDEEQSVHLDLDYPVAENLNRFLPIIKWILLIPHYVVGAILAALSLVAVIMSWFAILATGRYPRPLFDFVVGVGRYWLRISAYGFLLITDRYPPFKLGE